MYKLQWLSVGRIFFCQRSECASTLDPQASLLPVLSIITLNHVKSGCRDVKKRGDVYAAGLICVEISGVAGGISEIILSPIKI